MSNLRLHIGGSCGPGDEDFVKEQTAKLRSAGLLADVDFFPNLSRERKVEFFHSLTVFSVPAVFGEAFGLYLVEAMAAGVPVVQPRVAAFPELIEATGGGVVCDPLPEGLGGAIESLLLDESRLRALGEKARHSVYERFSVEHMAREMVKVFQGVAGTG